MIPRWWPARIYYGWALVWALGFTATVSYGLLAYGFAAFITPMHAELGWSKAQITGAYSIAQLVAGVASIPMGRWVDRHGTRGLMTAGSVGAALLLFAWAHVQSLAGFYAIWALMGVAMAAVFYEPAFAAIATWFRSGRSRALTLLTFLGGFASVVFVPLVAWLVAGQGWRGALVVIAAGYGVLTAVPHLVVLRRRPSDVGLVPDGGRASDAAADRSVMPERSVPAREAVRTPEFRWLALAFALSGFATTAVIVHLIPLLIERGYGATFAGGAMGMLGLMAMPGRLVFTPLGDRWRRGGVTALIFALQGAGLVAMLATRSVAGVWAFIVLFGLGFGALTPMRASLSMHLWGPADAGRIGGTLGFIISLARAAAPVGASLIYMAVRPGHGYDAVLAVLLAMSIASGAAVLAADGVPLPRLVNRLPRLAE